MLVIGRNPAPGDWLNWRRTDNAWGYSTLDQIKRDSPAASVGGNQEIAKSRIPKHT
jgi:hypothetical protein